MARKNIVASYDMFGASGTSLAATVESSTVNVQNLDSAGIHVSWTGSSPVGVITVQARNGSDDSWYDLDFGSTISVSGNTGNHQIVFNSLPFTDIKMTYTRTSGTGTIHAKITAKQLGG